MVTGIGLRPGHIAATSQVARVAAYGAQLRAPAAQALVHADVSWVVSALRAQAGRERGEVLTIQAPGCLPAALDNLKLGFFSGGGIDLERNGESITARFDTDARRRFTTWGFCSPNLERLADDFALFRYGLRVVSVLAGLETVDPTVVGASELHRRLTVSDLCGVTGLQHAGAEGLHRFRHSDTGREWLVTTRSARSE